MKTKNTTLREQFHNRIKNIVETHVTLTLMGLKPLSEKKLSYQYNDKHSHTRSSPCCKERQLIMNGNFTDARIDLHNRGSKASFKL